MDYMYITLWSWDMYPVGRGIYNPWFVGYIYIYIYIFIARETWEIKPLVVGYKTVGRGIYNPLAVGYITRW